MTNDEKLKLIVPGKTYPAHVKVTEKGGMVVDFWLNSFFVGMYCCIHVNGNVAHQTGDHNNKKFCTGLKKDIKSAIARGATVEIDDVRNCQLEMSK
jgi:hypothetical protein